MPSMTTIAEVATSIGRKAAAALTGGRYDAAKAYIDCGEMLAEVPGAAEKAATRARATTAAPATGEPRKRGRPARAAAKVTLTTADEIVGWLRANGPATKEQIVAGCNQTKPSQFGTVTKMAKAEKILLKDGLYSVPAEAMPRAA